MVGPKGATGGERSEALTADSGVWYTKKVALTPRRAGVAEWQTRRSQKAVRATSCGFESRPRYHYCGFDPEFRRSRRYDQTRCYR